MLRSYGLFKQEFWNMMHEQFLHLLSPSLWMSCLRQLILFYKVRMSMLRYNLNVTVDLALSNCFGFGFKQL